MSSSANVALLSGVLQKEALDLASRIWPDLSPPERQRIINTVLSMPEEDTGGGKSDSQQHRDYRVFLRLSVLARRGEEMLPEPAKVELARLRQTYPRWRVDEGERAHFLSWMEPSVGWPSQITSNSLLSMDDEALAQRLETENQDRAGLMAAWYEFCRQNPARGLAILRRLSKGGVEQEDLWAWGINGLRMQFSQPMVLGGVNDLLPTLTAARFHDTDLLRAAANILPEIARNRDRELSADFWVLWDRLVERAAREGDLPQDDEWAQGAIYHPGGVLALALVLAWSRVSRKAREGLGDFAPLFDRLLGDGVGLRFARIVLAGHLAYLYFVDPEWTTRKLGEPFTESWDGRAAGASLHLTHRRRETDSNLYGAFSVK
jgi:hypothetical protein